MNKSTPSPDDAIVAASPFKLARRALGGGKGLWGGKRHRYNESEWVRDRHGKWMAYTGRPWQESWETGPSGREAPTFAHGNVFDSKIGRTPRYKGRAVSPKLDDGSVIMEIGNSIRDLGRQETPGEDRWDGVTTDLPDTIAPGDSQFVRVDPDTLELVSDPAAKMGGRGVLTPEERARRGQIGQGPRARVGQEEVDEIDLPEIAIPDEVAESLAGIEGTEALEDYLREWGPDAQGRKMLDNMLEQAQTGKERNQLRKARKVLLSWANDEIGEPYAQLPDPDESPYVLVDEIPLWADIDPGGRLWGFEGDPANPNELWDDEDPSWRLHDDGLGALIMEDLTDPDNPRRWTFDRADPELMDQIDMARSGLEPTDDELQQMAPALEEAVVPPVEEELEPRFPSVPADAQPVPFSPVWEDRGFTPDDLAGWVGVPGDDSRLWSPDGRFGVEFTGDPRHGATLWEIPEDDPTAFRLDLPNFGKRLNGSVRSIRSYDEVDEIDLPAQRVPPVERGPVPRPRRGGEIPTPEVMDLNKRMEEIADEHLLADPARKEQIWGEFQALLKQRNAAWYDPQTAQALDEQSASALSPERRALLRELDPDFDSYPMLDQVDLLDGMQDQFTAVPGLEREEFDGAYAEVMEDLAYERENADELYGEFPDEEGLYGEVDEIDLPDEENPFGSPSPYLELEARHKAATDRAQKDAIWDEYRALQEQEAAKWRGRDPEYADVEAENAAREAAAMAPERRELLREVDPYFDQYSIRDQMQLLGDLDFDLRENPGASMDDLRAAHDNNLQHLAWERQDEEDQAEFAGEPAGESAAADAYQWMRELEAEYQGADPARKAEIWSEYQEALDKRSAAWLGEHNNSEWNANAAEWAEHDARALSPERRELMGRLDPDWDLRSIADQRQLLSDMDYSIRENPGASDDELRAALEDHLQQMAWDRQDAEDQAEFAGDDIDGPSGDGDVLSDEDRAALEAILAKEWGQVLTDEDEAGGPTRTYPNIERAKADLAAAGWAPDTEYPDVMVSPDGRYRATPMEEALGQTFDSVFVEDKETGEAAFWNTDRDPDFGAWLQEQLDLPPGERFGRGWTEPLPTYVGPDDGLTEDARAKAIRSNMFGAIDLDSADDPEVAERNNRIKALLGELAKDGNASLLQRFNDELGGMVGADAAADVLYEYGWDTSLGTPEEALPRLVETAGQMVREDPAGTGPNLRERLDEQDSEEVDELDLPEESMDDLVQRAVDLRTQINAIDVPYGEPVPQEVRDHVRALRAERSEIGAKIRALRAQERAARQPVDELDLPETETVPPAGEPVPVGRYKPGAHRGERAGRGENRGWISRPMGYRAADFRERDRRRAIEESVTEGAWDDLGLPDVITRATVREAAVEAGVSDKTLQRIDTALTPEDIVDAVDTDEAVDEIDLPGVGSDARVAVAKLLTQLGMLDHLDDPETGQPSASEEELEASGAAAADAGRRVSQPLAAQFQEIMDFYDANKDLMDVAGRGNFEKVSDKKGRNVDKRPKKQQFAEDLARFDKLPADRQKTLLTMLDWARNDLKLNAMRGNPDKKAVTKELADRFQVLVDSIKAQDGAPVISEWTKQQQNADARFDAAEDVMNTKTPARPYRYMDDYKDVVDYSTPDQQTRIQNAANLLGDVHLQAVDTFGVNSKLERELRTIRDDFADFINRTDGGPQKNQAREALLERAINQARLVAGKNALPELEEVRDALLEIRAEGHGQTVDQMLADTSWDVPDEELQAIYDALQQFAGTGTNKGKNYRNAAAAIKDILPGPRAGGAWNEGYAPGTPERWAALMRARHLLDGGHGEQAIPLMHAMGVKVDPRRVRKLLNPKFALAPENFGSRPDPRGTPWTQADLNVMSDTANRLRKIVEKDTSRNGGRYRATAKLLDSAVRAYNDQDYGAFEAISEIAMSHLSALNQDAMYQQLGALRDLKHGATDWNTAWDQLETDLVDIFGKVPKGQGISNPKTKVPTDITMRQKAMGLIAEAAMRPQGSLDQRTKLATALWLLNQVNDPKDADLRDALGPYGANGDMHQRQVEPYQRREPGTANDARIARSQEIAQRISDEGMLSGPQLQEALGLTPERLDGLVEPLINAGILRLVRRTPYGPVYAMGPNYFVHDPALEKKRPLTRKELDDMVMRQLADVMPSPVSPKPVVSHAFVDSRIVKRNTNGQAEGVVLGLGPETTPDRNVTAFWDAGTGSWVLSTFQVGDWKTFGLPLDESGAEVQRFMSLDSLRYGLTALADLNGIPYPGPMVAAVEPEDVEVEVRDEGIDGTTVVVVVVDDSGDEGDDGEGDDVLVLPVSDYLEPPPEYEEPVYPTQLPVFPVGTEELPDLIEDEYSVFPVGEEEIL